MVDDELHFTHVSMSEQLVGGEDELAGWEECSRGWVGRGSGGTLCTLWYAWVAGMAWCQNVYPKPRAECGAVKNRECNPQAGKLVDSVSFLLLSDFPLVGLLGELRYSI